MDRIAAARGANVRFRLDLAELRRCCTLRRRLATAIIIIILRYKNQISASRERQVWTLPVTFHDSVCS